MLIKVGLLDYVEERRAAGDGRLFPLLAPNGERGTTGFSKWWSRYSRKNGNFGPEKVFYSFRHTAKDAFRQAEVAESIYDALQSHTPRAEGGKYWQDYSLRVLADAMEKLAYDVDLKHLSK